MADADHDASEAAALAFLKGGGDMGERIRRHDWSRTPLGSPANWPQSLKTALQIMLSSGHPTQIGWPELSMICSAVFRLCGQFAGDPSGVRDQSCRRIRSPISPPPFRNAKAAASDAS